MLYEMYRPLMMRAENLAATGDDAGARQVLREMPLGPFGAVLASMPNSEYPHLSASLPRMAADEVQDLWTGTHGAGLLLLSVNFVNSLSHNYHVLTGDTLHGARVLDFGCGWGRMLRLMLSFTEPDNIWGVDPWPRSLEVCREDRVLGHLALSDYLPQSLPVDGDFNLAFAFSVFTHTSENATRTALAAIRKSMKPGGILALTIRPVEYWHQHRAALGDEKVDQLMTEHRQAGFAFNPHGWATSTGEMTYGDTSMTLEWLEQAAEGWKIETTDLSLDDPQQLIVFMKPN